MAKSTFTPADTGAESPLANGQPGSDLSHLVINGGNDMPLCLFVIAGQRWKKTA